jgi:uncharacterized membrane protein YgcG
MILLLCACSGGESESKGHVWKEQTDMIDKAQGVEDLLGTADAQQRQRIEEQTQ